jgi:hypothetical protein
MPLKNSISGKVPEVMYAVSLGSYPRMSEIYRGIQYFEAGTVPKNAVWQGRYLSMK